MQVGYHTRQDEEGAAGREQPPEHASAAPEQHADADQHRYQRYAERACAVKAPVGAGYAHLIGEQVSSDAAHGETGDELAEAARRPTHVAQTMVCHQSEDNRPSAMRTS